MSNSKYRPAFTIAHLQRMRDLTEVSEHITDQQIRKIVAPLLAKISMGITAPAYTQSQEAIDKAAAIERTYRYNNNLMTDEETELYEIEVLGM